MLLLLLSSDERKLLEEEYRSTSHRNYRDRLQIILLAHQGHQRKAIAQIMAVHRRTALRWIRAFLDQGLERLQPRKPT